MDKERARLVLRAHRLIHLRLAGWILIGVWQALSLLSEFVGGIDIESRTVRIIAKSTGLLGLVLVAYGFERFAEVSHRLGRLHR